MIHSFPILWTTSCFLFATLFLDSSYLFPPLKKTHIQHFDDVFFRFGFFNKQPALGFYILYISQFSLVVSAEELPTFGGWCEEPRCSSPLWWSKSRQVRGTVQNKRCPTRCPLNGQLELDGIGKSTPPGERHFGCSFFWVLNELKSFFLYKMGGVEFLKDTLTMIFVDFIWTFVFFAVDVDCRYDLYNYIILYKYLADAESRAHASPIFHMKWQAKGRNWWVEHE